MAKKIAWLVVSCLMVLFLVLASCAVAPAPAPTPTPTPTSTPTPTTTSIPTPKSTSALTTALGEPQYGGTITVAENVFTYIDPYRYESESTRINTFYFEKLVVGDWAVNRKTWGFPVALGSCPLQYMKGQLAESWETPDPLTIIVHIRKGVKFQDKPPVNGRELTAEDVVWNLKRIAGDLFITDREYIKLVDSVTARDKYTVEIKLTPPPIVEVVRGVLDCMNLQFIAKECVGASGLIEDWRKCVGTGPFIFEDLVTGSSVTFRKNPNYWDYDELHPKNRLPYVDGVKILLIGDISTWLAALRSGKIDNRLQVAWSDADSLKKNTPELIIKSQPGYTMNHFRMRVDKKPFTDVRVRQAMNMAIDLQAISKSYYGGYGLLYAGDVLPHLAEYTPYDKLPDKPKWTTVSVKEILSYNPEKAKKLLAEAGYPNGFKTNILSTPLRAPGLPEILQQYLKDIGVDAEIRLMEAGAFDAFRSGKKHDQIILYWNTQKPEPLYILGTREYDPVNAANQGMVDDPVFNKMFDEARQTFDDAKRSQMVHELDMYVLENAYLIPMPYPCDATIWQPWLGGYSGEGYLGAFSMGALYARLWVNRDLKKTMGR